MNNDPSLRAMTSPNPTHGGSASGSLTKDQGTQPRVSVVLVTPLVILMAWMLVLSVLNVTWHNAIDSHTRQSSNLARALEEQTIRVLAAVDQATLRASAAVRTSELGLDDFRRFANETGLAPEILTQLALIGPDGRFVGSNLDPRGDKTGAIDLSEREHVKVHLLSEPASEMLLQMTGSGLFVGRPVLGKVSGKWSIQLSRRITAPDGSLAGVVVASLNPHYFEDVYRGVQLGLMGSVTLVGDDRAVRARVVGGQSEGIGTTLTSAPSSETERLGQEGHYVRISNLDDVERIYAYRRVGDYPLMILVATSTEEALLEWRSSRNVAIATTTLLTLALITAAVFFLRGLRRLEQANSALRVSEAQARATSQAKSAFLADVSLDLRAPLIRIQGLAELMEQRLDHPRMKEQAGVIRQDADHLNALLTDILDLAKVDADAMPHAPSEQDLARVVKCSLEPFSAAAASKGLVLRSHIDPDTPATLLCDGARLQQILDHLVSNAVKFTEAGTVGVEVNATANSVQFHVVDNGPGIPVNLQASLFDRHRLDPGADNPPAQRRGLGLGLVLSHALAALMGGTLTVHSTQGQGSRFTLTLPRHLSQG
jgi:signal transduction histidine kinase